MQRLWARASGALAVVGLALASSAPARAEAGAIPDSENPLVKRGIYLNLTGVAAYPNFDGTVFDPVGDVLNPSPVFFDLPDSDAGLGFNAILGYRLHPRIAVEFQFQYIDEFQIDGTQSTLNFLAYSGNIKGFLTKGRIQPYIMVGVGALDASLKTGTRNNTIDFAARFGGGIDLLAERCEQPGFCYGLNLGASYVLTNGDVTSTQPNGIVTRVDQFDYISFDWGVTLRF